MINKLKNTFDYQKFSPNGRLGAMIDDVERRYAERRPMALSDEDLFFVAAAGTAQKLEEEEGFFDTKF